MSDETQELKGRLVVLEGIEGAGKSTQATLLVERLRAQGLEVIHTREPGGTPVAEEIRNLFLRHHEETIHPTTELLLVMAGRHQHLQEVVIPALLAGKWVVCERFVNSTYAYQVAGQGAPESLFWDLMVHVVQGIIPHLTVFLDIPDDLSAERLKQRGDSLDRLESLGSDFTQRVRLALRQIAEVSPKHVTIDATGDVNHVRDLLWAEVATLLPSE